MSSIAGILLKHISVRDSHAIVIRNLGRLTFSRITSANVLKSVASKKGKEFNLENFNTAAVTLRRHASKHKIHGGNHLEKPTGKQHKLFDCIRTPLKRFLAYLTFQRKEIRLRHLHKRTNLGSAPDSGRDAFL